MRRDVQRAIPIDGKIFVCPGRGAADVGISTHTLQTWVARGCTSYGLDLTVVHHGKHHLIAEFDLRVITEVNRKFPLLKGGPPERRRAEEMRRYATQVRAALTRAP